jgi:hypothetical protein
VYVEIAISRREDEAGAELEWILAQPMLAMPGSLGPGSCFGVVAAEDVEQISRLQLGSLVGLSTGVDQQGEVDAGFLTKHTGIVDVAQTDGGQGGSGLLELLLVGAQLRDMLAAENSAVVAKEDNHSGTLFPK